MKIDLTEDEIDSLLVSLDYTKHAMREAADTPYEVRQENLKRVESIAGKLRALKLES